MPNQRPNHWPNSATRCVATWIIEDVLVAKQWQQFATDVWQVTQADTPADRSATARQKLADELKKWVVDFNPLAGKVSVYADLLGTSISEVSWAEIADSLLARLEGYSRVGNRK